MPDDLQIPISSHERGHERLHGGTGVGRPSYRIDQPERGPDAATRRLLLFAGGALAVLLVLGGGWALMSRRPTGVPVIEADSRPLRVKPDNPGGMQVAGADEPDDAPSSLGPAPEAPAPLALRAQVQANRPPPAVAQVAPASVAPASVVPGPIAPDGAAAAGAQGGGEAASAAVASRQDSGATRPAAPVAAPAASVAGGAQVQLAAVDSEGAARAEWTRLQHKLPDLLAQRQPALQRATDKDGKAIWRVRTGGFADLADASGFCAKVRAKGAGCSLATF